MSRACLVACAALLALACPTGSPAAALAAQAASGEVRASNAAALAADASASQVRALAGAAARDDAAALRRLRAIARIDGRPADLDRVLRGAPPAELRERLRVLAEAEPARPPDASAAGDASAVARDVLADRRYRPSSFPQPFRRLTEQVGSAIASPFRAAFDWLKDHLGPYGAWTILAGAVLAGTLALAVRAGTRRQSASASLAGAERTGERVSAAGLRAQAQRAERAGDLDEALRLRFRAGLLDLDSRELIALRPALTNRELRSAVPSSTLDELVADFEAVAYGGRPAAEEDVRGARDGWPRVLEEARSR